MLKFPALPTKNPDMSYTNSCISEYISCKIYKSVGIPVQDVLLGTYTTEAGKEKIVVACKDFAVSGLTLQDFASLNNQIIDSEHNGYGTELHDILETFEQQTTFDRQLLAERFWDMFIVDALLRIKERIDMVKIKNIIDETPFITDLQRNFLKTLLVERDERILNYSLNLLKKSKLKSLEEERTFDEHDEYD